MAKEIVVQILMLSPRLRVDARGVANSTSMILDARLEKRRR